jgi:carbon monoxide dehydrogenase subunit G
MLIERSVTVYRPQAEVFAYLADFTTTTEWDPGTQRTTRVSGDGGVGTTYRNVSRFLGRRTELTYVVTDHQAPRRLQLRGENDSVIAHDTMTLVAAPFGSTTITYRAEFEFKGWARLAAPLAAPALRRLGDRAAQQLQSALDSPHP